MMRKFVMAASLSLAATLLRPPGGPLPQATPLKAQEFTPRDETPEEFPDHPNREEAFYACVACHAFRLVAQQGMDRSRWDDSIQLMVDRHNMPALTESERKAVLDYLEAAFPPRAPAGGGGWSNPFAPR